MFLYRNFHFDAPPYHPNDKFGYIMLGPLTTYQKEIGIKEPTVGKVYHGVKGSRPNDPPIIIGHDYIKNPLMLYEWSHPVGYNDVFKVFEVYDRGDVTTEYTRKGGFTSPTFQVYTSVELEVYRQITDIDELVCILGYLDIRDSNGRVIERKTTYRKHSPNTGERFLYDRGRLMEYTSSSGEMTRYRYDSRGNVYGY